MPVEYLRIVGEAASFQRSDPGNPRTQAVLNHWLEVAARRHSIGDLVAASELSELQVSRIVGPTENRSSLRRIARGQPPARLWLTLKPSKQI